MGVSCFIFIDFEEMVSIIKLDLVIVMIKDFIYYEFIVKGLDMGCDVLIEKLLIMDEDKC